MPWVYLLNELLPHLLSQFPHHTTTSLLLRSINHQLAKIKRKMLKETATTTTVEEDGQGLYCLFSGESFGE